MIATFLGFITFAMICLHVVGAYSNINNAVELDDNREVVSRELPLIALAGANGMMAVFWLLVTSRLLGW